MSCRADRQGGAAEAWRIHRETPTPFDSVARSRLNGKSAPP